LCAAGAPADNAGMPFAYYDRLSAARQRTYRRSDAIETVEIPDGFLAGTAVAALRRALAAEAQRDVQSLCQQLNDALSRALAVPPVRMVVMAQRPSDDYGELHGLYEPEDAGRCARITVWMRTARRQQVVAYRSFVRTLAHEWCHHLDYELYRLPETFHTEGFYKRESSIANRLLALEAAENPV
jgi:hypothetical protein